MPAPVVDTAAPAVMSRAAAFRPASYREADNSMEVCWSTGAAGLRFDWYDGGYYIEELSMEPGAVRLDRLNAGACVLDSHRAGSLDAVLGSIVPGTARVANGEGTARVRLASTPDVANIVAKIVDGHIRNLSVSYHVYEFQRTERRGDDHPHMLATDWEPTEISMVAVPFDAAAQVRSRSTHNMPDAIETPPAPRSDTPPAPASRGMATVARIREACSRTDDLSRAFERTLIADHEDEPMTMRDVQRRVADELIAVRERGVIDTRTSRDDFMRGDGGRGHALGSPGMLGERMADALFARMSRTAPSEQAREFMDVSMVSMARAMLEARGERVRWAGPGAVVDAMSRAGTASRAGSMTTSDFPGILGNAVQRHLGALIAATPSPLRAIARQRLASDFRRMAVMNLGANPALLIVKENGEIKHGSITESGEGYALNTYARIVPLSRQMIINDDLGAFIRIFEGWARAANDLEANILKSQIENNGLVMADGKTLYHADHGNLAVLTGTAQEIAAKGQLNVDNLSTARMAMRMQKDYDGGGPLNIAPRYLVVGAAQETAAEKVLAQLAAATPAAVNPFAGKLELIVDGRLPGYSWRLFADPAQWPVIEEARLAGQEDVFIDTHVSFEVDGIKTKARLDIAAAATDWHGTYMNPGAAPA